MHMSGRRLAVYYAWSQMAEADAPMSVIEDRFPALFESRRMLYPRFAEFSDPDHYDQGVGGFLDHIMKANFSEFVDLASHEAGSPVIEHERVGSDARKTSLEHMLDDVDTVIVIGFDSLRTGQQAEESEVRAAAAFLAKPGNLLIVSPHHDIGEVEERSDDDRSEVQLAEFLHHGDKTIPPRQGFGGFGRSLLMGLGVPIENRFGLRPASEPDGSPAPIEAEQGLDRLKLLDGVSTFNLHPHLPHLERLADAAEKMDVLVRQRIDPSAPPHPFTRGGRSTFDALLQSKPGAFAGDLLVSDATLWSSTAGGVDNLRRLWTNLMHRRKPFP
jgi:hypothetical protein